MGRRAGFPRAFTSTRHKPLRRGIFQLLAQPQPNLPCVTPGYVCLPSKHCKNRVTQPSSQACRKRRRRWTPHLEVLAENHPATFGWFLRWYDEMFTVLDFLVQHHYVQKYSASFAENFYDLKRVPSGDSAGEKLSKTLQWRSILNLVGVPYLKQKLEQLFQDLKYKEDMLPRGPDAPLKARLCRAFLGIYPFIHMLWEGVALWHILAYAFKQSCWHSFPMHLSGTELRHRTEDDAEFVIADMAWTEVVPRRNIGFAAVKLLQGVVSALSTGLSVSIFFLQFLDWWYNSDASAPSLTALPMPSPPQV
ncbi:hypothetical protein C0Q70_08528 [Pomacea canaliculata]|uniref:Pex N-terminal domain-containing protein n=1 Tax=Pomacea canaliculata TaxID=400727 RepID=A0A2T7PI37_POMCA|nr:hypothetical protein C0Q70_08528 [Pomacea canaliculata]